MFYFFSLKPSKLRVSEQGITLLLSILVLSAISAISFSLATIVAIEIRSSGDVARTEPALYASESITEEALFQVKRQTSFAYTSTVNGVSIPTPVVETLNTTPYIDGVGAGNTKRYQLVDPTNLYAGSKYGRVKVTFINTAVTGTITVNLYETDPVGSYISQQVGSTPTSINPGASWQYDLDITKQYDLDVTNNASSSVTISVDSYDNAYASKGLPYVGQTALDITAQYGGLTRRYYVRIPNQ